MARFGKVKESFSEASLDLKTISTKYEASEAAVLRLFIFVEED